MIQFLCPNGHKIRCADDRAGKAAKCPRCGVKFRVPNPDELEAGPPEPSLPDFEEQRSDFEEHRTDFEEHRTDFEEHRTDLEEQSPEAEEQSPAAEEQGPKAEELAGDSGHSSVRLGAAENDRQIEFLCPNNHLLHGPENLQGQPGECPECGSRFRIPSYDEMEDQEEDEQEIEPEPTLPPIRAAETAIASHASIGPALDLILDSSLASSAEQVTAAAVTGPISEDGPVQSIATLFAKLWAAKHEGASVELRYSDNQRLNPDHFLADLSQGTHAVFAMDEANRTYTLMAVAWDSIFSVVVRGVRGLPGRTA